MAGGHAPLSRATVDRGATIFRALPPGDHSDESLSAHTIPEYVAGPEGAAYHLRPPLDPTATQLYAHLQGPRHRATVNIDLSRSRF